MAFWFRTYGRQVALLLLLLGMMMLLGQKSPRMLEAVNLLDSTRNLTEAGILAVGMTLVIMTGGIDLSIGALLALCGIAFGFCQSRWGVSAGVAGALITGIAGGALNGALVSRMMLPPLVVTLATMALFRGVATVVSKAEPYTGFPESFATLGRGSWPGAVPLQLYIWIIISLAGMILVSRMRWGRYVAAVGDNETAARYSAIGVDGVKMAVYVFNGFLCAVAALIYTSRVSTAKADAALGWELDVIVAVVLGGTAITGGKGTVVGSLLGVLFLGYLRTGFSMVGISSVYQTITAGALLIVVSILNQRLGMISWPKKRTKPTVAVNGK